MNIEKCVVCIEELFSSNTYATNLGYPYFQRKINDKWYIELSIVKCDDYQPRFINIFGLLVDINSEDYNICLGILPMSSSYVVVTSLKDLLYETWFGSKDLGEYSVDLTYILELMKLDPVNSYENIIQVIREELDNSEVRCRYSSVLKNMVVQKYKLYKSKFLEYFEKKYIDHRLFLIDTMSVCINVHRNLEEISKSYYGNYILETSVSVIDKNRGKSIKDLSNSKYPNIESLTLRYLGLGIPYVMLWGLISYGFECKNRHRMFKRMSLSESVLKAYKDDLDEFVKLGKSLSSGVYIRVLDESGVSLESQQLAYNFMNMISSSGEDMDVMFAIDSITRLKSLIIWKEISEKYNLKLVTQDLRVSEKDLVLDIDKYMNDYMLRASTGSLYSRKPIFFSYSMSHVSPYQLDTSGRLFSNMCKVLKNKINQKGEEKDESIHVVQGQVN